MPPSNSTLSYGRTVAASSHAVITRHHPRCPYQIDAPLGAGGMGEVYKATDTRLDRTVAIKVLPEHAASDPDLKQRFEEPRGTCYRFCGGRAKTKILFPVLGCSSGVSRNMPNGVPAVPVLTATYCRPSTA